MDPLDPFDFTVDGTGYVHPAPDWNGKPFQINTEKEWRGSVHRCYPNVPKETLQRFKFVYNIDSEEQREVKTQAAIHAYNWVMDEFDKEFSHVPNHDDVKSMLESQVDYFFAVLELFFPSLRTVKCVNLRKSIHKYHFISAHLVEELLIGGGTTA